MEVNKAIHKTADPYNINDLVSIIDNLADTASFKDYHEAYRIVYRLCIEKENSVVSALYGTGLQKIEQEADMANKEKMLQTLNNIFAYSIRIRIIKSIQFSRA